MDKEQKKMMAVSVVSQSLQTQIEVPPNTEHKIKHFISIVYNDIEKTNFDVVKKKNEDSAIKYMRMILNKPYDKVKQAHIDVWNKLWNSGFSISNSKASGTLNGDVINETIYYVLSSVPAYYHEETSSLDMKTFVTKSLLDVEGCYGSHQTLEAKNLWNSVENMADLKSLVSLWLLTLDKQGCHNLIKSGADGVLQAMILSFGSFRFSNQHLEFNLHPSFLHRTYQFRRINYGNQTHINVTVDVDESNKAMLYVAVDRSDKAYYACDGGCLDTPVPLGPETVQLPVKLTNPFTSILYITSNKQHMEELRHALHVKDVAEAPAQEQTMIVMHKHGHHLGGLPTFFWVSILTLIVIFHLFLIKMVYNEYWNENKYKTRPSDSIYRANSKYRFLH